MPRQTSLGEIAAATLNTCEVGQVALATGIPSALVRSLKMGEDGVEMSFDQWHELFRYLEVDTTQIIMRDCASVTHVLPTLGDKLKSLRGRKGLTQEAAAKAIGISYASLVQYEANRRTPPYPTILRITRALGVPTDYFADCDFDDEKEAPEPPPPALPKRPAPPPAADYDDDDIMPTGGGDPIPF